MNVSVKHNGTTITSRVISYEREHKICTGIGTLTIILEGTYSTAIAPWDTIDIHENGDFKVRYYVSQVSRIAPEGTIVLECQDISKKIVDYFIPDSYTINYPTYNKYWISFFLDEAGVSYEYVTDSPGTLLSNYTQLGLVSVYDQLQTLLQMSGWYMYFDGNGKAIIGSLDVDFAEDHASVDKTDILDIKVIKNDKMLRNKAMVFGAYDPYTGSNAKASITVHTPWNYDHNDLRPIIISNSNIPDSETAYGMANQIIKEFAKITVEKHITVWGARDYNLGTALRAVSNIWKGRGLITTFGVSMSSSGLKTHVILDERCPRLFGFFDFGDYVYVATYGEGVWRKHIKYDPTWYNFSTGLTELAITDMHINNGVFGSVGASGSMFYAIEDLPWNPLSLANGLESSVEDNVDTELTYDEIEVTTFSGLMARAIVVDKLANTVKFAIDNASGVNYGDYFLDHSGTTVSGVVSSGVAYSGASSDFSGKRSWIVDYDVMGGDYTGTAYPISLSGCYAYTVLDLDNDGIHDYVSVATSGSVAADQDIYNFGTHTSYNPVDTNDSNNRVAYNLYDDFSDANQTAEGSASPSVDRFAVFNNETDGEREIVVIASDSGIKLKRISITKTSSLSVTTLTSPALPVTSEVYVYKSAPNTYDICGFRGNGVSGTELYDATAIYFTWDTVTNTFSSVNDGERLIINKDATKSDLNQYFESQIPLVIDNMVYKVSFHWCQSNDTTSLTNYIDFYMHSINMETKESFGYLINRVDFETGVAGLGNPKWKIYSIAGGLPDARWWFQKGNYPSYAFMLTETSNPIAAGVTARHWLVYSQYGGTFQKVLIEEDTYPYTSFCTGVTQARNQSAQVTGDYFYYFVWGATSNTALVYNSLNVSIVSTSSIPFSWASTNVYPMFGAYDDFYIALNGSDFYKCDPVNLSATELIQIPDGYTPIKPFSTSHSVSPLYYWQMTNDDTTYDEILRYSTTGYMGSSIKPDSWSGFTAAKGIICGNFFIESQAIAGGFRWLYVDNPEPDRQTTVYQILQRTENEFKLIQQEAYPMRVDISHNSPVLTVGSGDATFQSNYVYESELVTISPVPSGVLVTASGNQVNDYRYVSIEPMAGEFPIGTGLGIQTTALYISSGIIYAADTLTYSGGFQPMYMVPSGYNGTRIETSNYGIGGQYIFITAAGVTQEFFQSDPGMLGVFTMYSGMPQSRATIIRLDDSM